MHPTFKIFMTSSTLILNSLALVTSSLAADAAAENKNINFSGVWKGSCIAKELDGDTDGSDSIVTIKQFRDKSSGQWHVLIEEDEDGYSVTQSENYTLNSKISIKPTSSSGQLRSSAVLVEISTVVAADAQSFTATETKYFDKDDPKDVIQTVSTWTRNGTTLTKQFVQIGDWVENCKYTLQAK